MTETIKIKPKKLRPGDLVYRIVDYDPPTEPHTWRVESATVVSASDRQITLRGANKLRIAGQRFKPNALGTLFFATENDAAHHFARVVYAAYDKANRMVTEANRSLVWLTHRFPGIRFGEVKKP